MKSAAVLLMFTHNAGGTASFKKSPMEIKYILTTQCPNPAETKAVIGKMIDKILYVLLCALKQNQTAGQTNALHIIPNEMAWANSNVLVRQSLILVPMIAK